MKVKAVYTCDDYYHGLTKGKTYEVSHTVGLDCYDYINDYGNRGSAYKSRFTIITDTPQIEVGSEWVSSNDVDWIVAYVGKYVVINNGEQEICVGKEKFIDKWKPKPKTVIMYFYKDCTGLLHACEKDINVFGGHIFTREIEL